MLTPTDLFISWSIIGALAGALSYLARRQLTEDLFGRMFDGFLGACMGGEFVHRWDASAAAGAPGMIAAAAGSICFVLFLRRLRPA
jgi:uncharacterized membrane protein YeaQ/YmgE (transglycosylase-associated protein family)